MGVYGTYDKMCNIYFFLERVLKLTAYNQYRFNKVTVKTKSDRDR